MTTTQNPVDTTGQTIAIKHAGEVYQATNIIFIQTHVHSAAECGCDSVPGVKHKTSRWTQTTISNNLQSGVQTVSICDNYVSVNVRIDENAAQLLLSNSDNSQQTQETLLKCLARIEWNGADSFAKELTAWRLIVKEGMNQLLKEVLDAISNETNLRRLSQAVEKLFQSGMKLMGIDSGSLVFIFQHSSRRSADAILSSSVDQQKVQKILLDFLPDWVKDLDEGDISWKVVECKVGEGQQTNSKLGGPIELNFQQSSNVSSVDHRIVKECCELVAKNLTDTQKLVAKNLTDTQEYFAKFQSELLQKVTDLLANLKESISGMEQNIQEPLANYQSDKLQDVTESKSGMKQIIEELFAKRQSEKYQDVIESKSGMLRSEVAGFVQSESVNENEYLENITEQNYRDEGERYNGMPAKRIRINDQLGKQATDFSPKDEPFEPELDQVETDSDEHKKLDSRKKIQQSKILQAEQLLNWVNVKSKASESTDPEIVRMMEQVEHALQDEEQPAPRARALDTVLVLDTSDSVATDQLDMLKTAVHTFIDSIEENVDTLNLEENLAVVQMGGRAYVRQHLTNDYNRVRDAIDCMTPDSKTMRTGGKTPIFQALLVCLGAIEGRGGIMNVAGCHRVRPRVIFFTDGCPTDEAMEFGPDEQSNINEVKYALVQLISEFTSKKHKTTPLPIFWVPIGSKPDRPFLESLSALSGSKVVEVNEIDKLSRYYKVQETIGCVYKMVRKHKDIYEKEDQILSIINALAGNLKEDEKKFIIEEVRKKQKDPESETTDVDDFDNVFEDTESVAAGRLLPLGTRVVRGSDWKWNNQDTEGAGTVIQHRKKQDGWLYVLWDNGTHNVYRYGDSGCYDIEKIDISRALGTELIEIGVHVRRGVDWNSGDEDGNGVGVIIRKRKDGKVKVRWENGYIGKYRYGADNKMELRIIQEAGDGIPEQKGIFTTSGYGSEEELGAVGGYDSSKDEGRRVFQWFNQKQNEWRTYKSEDQDKILQAYSRRKDGTCVITRDGASRRLLFKQNQEKAIDKGGMTQIRTQVVSEEKYREMLQEEENR